MIRTISILFCTLGLMLAATAAWAGVPGDCDGDGAVTADDVAITRAAVGSADGDADFNAGADVDGDGVISLADLNEVMNAAK